MSSEVKGTWFVTLRKWGAHSLPANALPQLVSAMPHFGHAISDPQQHEWYPEDALHEVFIALWDHVGRDERRFVEISRQVSHQGVGSFFRALLGLSSSEFLLKQVPTLWRRLRRNDDAVVVVESTPGASIVRYSQFPWFDHEIYVLFTKGSLTALAELTGPRRVEVELVERKPGSAAFRVNYG